MRSSGGSPFSTVIRALFILLVVGGSVAALVSYSMEQERKRVALASLQQAAAEENSKIANSLEKGNASGARSSVGRMREQFERTATQLTGDDATAMKVMAKVLGNLEKQDAAYHSCLVRLTDAKVFAFDTPDQAVLESHREMLNAFLKSNADLRYALSHSEDLMRTEFQAAKVPPRVMEAVIKGYQENQHDIRNVALEVRGEDQQLGETGLALIDLLENNMGRWRRDPDTSRLIFQEGATATAYNDLIKKVKSISAAEAGAQKQLVEKLRAPQRRGALGGASPTSAPDQHPL